MHWIFAHLIGDYIFQSDWLAVGKKKKTSIALIHTILYIFPFILFNYIWWDYPLWKFALIALQHFLQDRWNFVLWTMKYMGKNDFSNFKIFGPWGIILMDNIYHILFIVLILDVF